MQVTVLKAVVYMSRDSNVEAFTGFESYRTHQIIYIIRSNMDIPGTYLTGLPVS